MNRSLIIIALLSLTLLLALAITASAEEPKDLKAQIARLTDLLNHPHQNRK